MKLLKIGLIGVVLSLGITGVVSAESKIKPQSLPDNYYKDLGWRWPTTNSTISDEWGGSRNHKGVDIAVYKEPVYASADGEVIFSGKYSDGAYTITIEHDDKDPNGNKLISRSIHLLKGSLKYGTGENVDRGDKIATSGNSGASDPGEDNNYHLHWDVNNEGDDTPSFSDTINPENFWPSKFDLQAVVSKKESLDGYDKDSSLYDDPERFFDQILIDHVGEQNFDQWFNNIKESDRTLTNFKKHFHLEDKEVNEILNDEIEENRKNSRNK